MHHSSAPPSHNGSYDATPASWEPLPSEPANWYARFESFRLLGPERTVAAAHRLHSNAHRPGPQWFDIAKRYRWSERAAAWDEHTRNQLRQAEETRRFDAREKRLAMITEVLERTFQTVKNLALDDITTETLPTLRTLFRDLLTAHRIEFELYQPTPAAGSTVNFTIEDLRAAHDELKSWMEAETT